MAHHRCASRSFLLAVESDPWQTDEQAPLLGTLSQLLLEARSRSQTVTERGREVRMGLWDRMCGGRRGGRGGRRRAWTSLACALY